MKARNIVTYFNKYYLDFYSQYDKQKNRNKVKEIVSIISKSKPLTPEFMRKYQVDNLKELMNNLVTNFYHNTLLDSIEKDLYNDNTENMDYNEYKNYANIYNEKKEENLNNNIDNKEVHKVKTGITKVNDYENDTFFNDKEIDDILKKYRKVNGSNNNTRVETYTPNVSKYKRSFNNEYIKTENNRSPSYGSALNTTTKVFTELNDDCAGRGKYSNISFNSNKTHFNYGKSYKPSASYFNQHATPPNYTSNVNFLTYAETEDNETNIKTHMVNTIQNLQNNIYIPQGSNLNNQISSTRENVIKLLGDSGKPQSLTINQASMKVTLIIVITFRPTCKYERKCEKTVRRY